MKLFFLVSCAMFCVPLTAIAAPQASNQGLQSLLGQVGDGSGAFGGISPEKGKLASKIQAHGPAAIPSLLALLLDKRANVRDFAGFVLRDQPGLTEDHLAALVAALDGGNGWIPVAIARIGTPAALRALVDALARTPETQGQFSFAFKLAGGKADPLLVALFASKKSVGPGLTNALCEIFDGLSNPDIVDSLLRVALNSSYDTSNRVHAIATLGCVGQAARSAIAPLRELVREDPAHFKDALNNAIRRMKTSETAALLIEELRAQPDTASINEIALLGADGRDAGPVLTALLSHSNRELRLAAALALGHVEYTEAGSALIPLLSEPDDWRLVYVTASSLARLKTSEALSELRQAVPRQWYPPVAREIRKAIGIILGVEKPALVKRDRFSTLYPFANLRDTPKRLLLPAFVSTPDQLARGQLTALAFEMETPTGNDAIPIMRKSVATPGSGVKVEGGYLIGVDHGEWGGLLAYSSGASTVDVLLHKNTFNVHTIPYGTIAITGLSHLAANDGQMYVVRRDAVGKYSAIFWKTLPGAPLKSGRLGNGNLLIDCLGGTVVVTPTGELSMASPANMR